MVKKAKPPKSSKKDQLSIDDFLAVNPGEAKRLTNLLLADKIEEIAEPSSMASDQLTSREMTISPAQARYFLRHGHRNRDSDVKRVALYARKMLNNEWVEDPPHPQGLVFDKAGQLIDGKTRLLAVIKADKDVRFYVTLGADKKVIRTMDSGRGRSIAQTGAILGLGTTTMSVSITKGLWIDPSPENRRIPRVTDPDAVFDRYTRYKEGIDFACRRYGGAKGGVGVSAVRSVIARAYYRPEVYLDSLGRYLEVLDTGFSTSELEINAVMVRNFYLNLPGRQGESGTLELHRKTIFSLDKYLKEEPITRLLQAKKQLFPLPD